MAFLYNTYMNASVHCLYAVPSYHYIQCFKEKKTTTNKQTNNNPETTCPIEELEKYFLISQVIN